MPASGKQIWETGSEPEFVVDQIARVEPMRGGMVRLYLASERQGSLRIEYTVVISIERLAEIGRFCLTIAADAHNCEMIWKTVETSH